MDCAWRVRALVACIALACACVASPPAIAAWGPNPITVKSTNASIEHVGSCSDGHYGAFVVWTEPEQSRLDIRGQHVLADGTLDPAWPAAGATVVYGVPYSPTHLETVPDRSGGLYVWWTDSAGSIFVIHVASNGTTVPGWPATGRAAGFTEVGWRPSVIADGGNGLFLAWSTLSSFNDLSLLHIGPLNTGDGWPDDPFNPIGVIGAHVVDLWPHLALAPGGGVYVGTATANLSAPSPAGQWRLARLAAGGLTASGWPAQGRVVGMFDIDPLFNPPVYSYNASLIDICADGRGGVFMTMATPQGGSPVPLEARVRRFASDGSDAVDWPAGGETILGAAPYEYYMTHADVGARAFRDGAESALAGVYVDGLDGANDMSFEHCAGGGCDYSGYVYAPGYELVSIEGAPAWFGSFKPMGPFGPFDPWAFLAVTQMPAASSWPGWYESHSEPAVTWYGDDISIASIDDGGSVLFWSQVNQLHGLFARRFGAAGQVTAVGPPPATAALTLRQTRFVRGEGVRVRMSVPAGVTASLTLFDIAGRRRAEESLPGGSDHEVMLSGTASLPAGVYFVAARAGGNRASDRGVVLP